MFFSWKVPEFERPENTKAAFLDESSFATLFPKYREKYLREIWPVVTKALEPHGIGCMLDLIHGSMSVKTTRKAWDPSMILKARDLIKLLSRGVPANQAIKVLDDAVFCDIIKIGNMVSSKEKFAKRRQRIVGPEGSTLKAIELLTSCYVLVQGNTVSVMGPARSLPEVRRIVTDCMRNIHPIYRIKELMIRRELAKDPKLADASWDRFLPKYKKRNLTTAEKTAKKRAKDAKEGAGVDEENPEAGPSKGKKVKKPYTPFPPPIQPRKVDIEMETGEYWLKPQVKKAKEEKEKLRKQLDTKAQRKAEKEKVYAAPVEVAEDTAEERVRKRKAEQMERLEGAREISTEKQRKKKKRKLEEISSDFCLLEGNIPISPVSYTSLTATTQLPPLPHSPPLSPSTSFSDHLSTINMASARIWQPPAGTHNVTIGPTMQAALESLDGPPSAPSLTEYYSVTYDYRPPSLDARAAGKISATNEPQSDGLPSFKMQYGSAEAGDLHAFAGSQSQAKEFECVLIYDEATGEFTFERLDSVITLEYDRASSSHATSRPLDNSPGSAGTVSSGSPPTPPNVAYNGFDNVQVAGMNFDEDTEEIAPVASKPAPPSRPTHAAKSVMVVAPPERPERPERPAVPAKGKGKRNRDALAEKDPPARQPPAKRLPAPAAPRPQPPALPAAPLALPPRPPPTPPSGLRSPNYVPASDINVFDDEDDVPLLSKGFTLEVEENPVLPPAHRPFSEGLIEEEAPNIDTMFDGLDYDEEDGEAEGEDDDQEDDDDFRIDVDEVDQAPRGPPISMNDLAGGEDDDDDDEDDDEDESDEDSD